MNLQTVDVTTAAGAVETRDLPILDLAAFLADEPGAKEALAEQLRFACENIGFMAVRNHGVSQDLIDRIFAEAKRFHALDMDEKTKIKVNQNQRGYVVPGATMPKHSTYNDNTKYDLNGTLVFATEYGPENPHVRENKRFYSANQWPEGLPGFRETVNEYMATITTLGKRLLPVWALALDLPEDYFAPYFGDDNYTYFRMAHYPPKPVPEENEFGLGAHADTGFMTFLPQADVDGLEILDTEGVWFRPPKLYDCLLVNTGQFLERWSNGRFRATPHRVIPPKTQDRYSVACFVNPDFEPIAECLPTCHSADNPPQYPTESYWDFYKWYMANTYPHYEEFHEEA